MPANRKFVATVITLWAGAAFAQKTERFELPAEQRTGSIRRVFVLPHSHLDIGFTLPPDQVARDYKDSIDIAIRLVRENQDFRWTIESTWMLAEWLRRTDDERLVAELTQLLRNGRISLGAGFANMHSGLLDTEEMNRLVYLAESYRRRFGIRSEVVFQNDVPGFSWSYPRVFAGSGVRYLITGLNLFIGGGNNFGVRNTPFNWIGPDGSRVLTWFSYDSYVEGYRWKLSSNEPIEEMERTVPRRLAWLEKNGYAYDTYLLLDAVSDNGDPMRAYRTLLRIREWNRRHPELPMQMCIAEEFFSYITAQAGGKFKEASGDATGHWELVKLGAPEAASRMRETAALLPAAEALATIDMLVNKSAFPRFDFADAWRELLVFHEHTAGAGPGWPGYYSRWQTDWSNAAHYSAAMGGYSNTRQLFDKAVARLAGSTGLFDPAHWSRNGGTTLLVYNGLSQSRSGPVKVELPSASAKDGPLEIVDQATGAVLPAQAIPGKDRHILFFASAVPAMGYRLYSVRKATRPHAEVTAFPINVQWNENGWINSIRSVSDGTEIVDSQSKRPFGGLFVSRKGGQYEPVAESEIDTSVTNGPVCRRIEINRKNSALRRTTITMYPNAPYIDVEFDVDLGVLDNASSVRYAIAFPFAAASQLIVDGPGSVIRIPGDILPGGGASQYTPLHFVHFRLNNQSGVTLANRDAALFRPDGLFLVASESLSTKTRGEGEQRLHRTEPRGDRVQRFGFRVAVQSNRVVDWKTLGQEFNLPLEAAVVPSTNIPPERSFLAVNHPNVRITAFKPAEFERERYIIRFQEMSGESAENIRLATPFPVLDAAVANTVESSTGERLDLSKFSLKPWQTLTALVRIKR